MRRYHSLLTGAILGAVFLGICLNAKAQECNFDGALGDHTYPWAFTFVDHRYPTYNALLDGPISEAGFWLWDNLREIEINGERRFVVAWQDYSFCDPESCPDFMCGNGCPTEECAPGHLQGYLVTDNLWASRALGVFSSFVGQLVYQANLDLGYAGNNLHDALFHCTGNSAQTNLNGDTRSGLSFDMGNNMNEWGCSDWVHGRYIGTCTDRDGNTVKVRAHDPDGGAAEDFPNKYIDSRIYAAFNKYWSPNETIRNEGKQMVLDILQNSTDENMFLDRQSFLLVDLAGKEKWENFSNYPHNNYHVSHFKTALLLYAIVVMGLGNEIDFLTQLRLLVRLLESHNSESSGGDGGFAHSTEYEYNADGLATFRGNSGSIGEPTAMAILALTARHTVNRCWW